MDVIGIVAEDRSMVLQIVAGVLIIIIGEQCKFLSA